MTFFFPWGRGSAILIPMALHLPTFPCYQNIVSHTHAHTRTLTHTQVLATPDSSSDGDYARIEGVVAHEYFHNWTGGWAGDVTVTSL
jgi:hypothetical protein